MILHNYKFTRVHTAFGGQVTFHMIPYRTVMVDVVISAIAPNREAHDVQALFALCDTLTVDIEFGLLDDAPVALQAFEAYWRERPSDIQARWEMFTALDTDVVNVWWDAYIATRDKEGRLDAPEA